MKVLKKDYEDIGECIRSDQVPSNVVAGYFLDKNFLKWYRKRYDMKEEPETPGDKWVEGYREWKKSSESYHQRLGRMIKKVKAETKWKDIFKIVEEAQRRLNEKK